jgi:hypothetical protein
MCAGCALTAMAGASGARAWLQAYCPAWLTEQRLKRATVAIFIVAVVAGTTKMSGSTPPAHAATHAAQQAAVR